MIAFSIHCITADATEGIVISHDENLSEEAAAEHWWKENKSKGAYPLDSYLEAKDIFASKQDLTII